MDMVYWIGWASLIGASKTLLALAKDVLAVLSEWRKREKELLEKGNPRSNKTRFVYYEPDKQSLLIDCFYESVRNLMWVSTPVIRSPVFLKYITEEDDEVRAVRGYYAFGIEKQSNFPYFDFCKISLVDGISTPLKGYHMMYRGPLCLYDYMMGSGFFALEHHSPPCDGADYLEGKTLSVVRTAESATNKQVVSIIAGDGESSYYYRKNFNDITMKKETRKYLRASVTNFLSFQTQYDLSKSRQSNKFGLILHGEKGTGKSEVAKSILPENSFMTRLVPTCLEDLVTLLNKVIENSIPSVSDESANEGWMLDFHAPYAETIRRGRSTNAYQIARIRGYTGSWEEFLRDYDPKEIADFDPTPFAIIIDDFDRIDFSETQHIPSLLSAIDRLGHPNRPVILIATTNDYRLIPDVIRRPGRFSFLVKFELFDDELINEYIDLMWESVTPEQRQKLHTLLNGKAPAWVYSMVTKSTTIDTAIDTLQEATRQDWKFEHDSTENIDAMKDWPEIYDDDESDEYY